MKFSNTYIFVFTTIVVLICATILTLASVGLQPFQRANRQKERMTQILTASGYKSVEDPIQFYNTVAEESEVEVLINGKKEQRQVIKVKLRDNSYCYVFSLKGKGLWGPIWGYIAIREDGNTVQGAVFDHKSETPGLGDEINTERFYSQFEGKQLFDQLGVFQSIKVVKGGVANSNVNPNHGVDAISGGTITSQGLETMIAKELEPYIPLLIQINKKERSLTEK
ncbi:MAG TPA: FMN-binding protein [Bacteroidales bacterium]|nr:FMN-binding protein [Bacteroidales bacterium]HOH21935.1 FMN-binding protein [Bacteroidales bacterium]HPB57861.1 FMN-binding protein [Bacteroidales bacterium]HPZ03534.1 FMN-binding protein [Bacteroidales bacterium]HQB74856.1 FMN-binding protein [Bacteroidales bacterium]